jgi:hypothetical protein
MQNIFSLKEQGTVLAYIACTNSKRRRKILAATVRTG